MSDEYLNSLPKESREAIERIAIEAKQRRAEQFTKNPRTADDAMADSIKDFPFTLRMSAYEKMLLDQVARQRGKNRSELARQVLKETLEKMAAEASDPRHQTLDEQVAELRKEIQDLTRDVHRLPNIMLMRGAIAAKKEGSKVAGKLRREGARVIVEPTEESKKPKRARG